MADTRDLSELIGLGGRGVAAATQIVRDVHVGIARRAFRASGPAARPAHLLHDGISRTVYAAVGAGARAAATATGAAVAVRAATDASYRPIADRPRGDVVIGALNGAWGDWLATSKSPLALDMSIRHVDEPRTGDVVVWLHGLCETDAAWRLGAQRHWLDATSTHGSRLRADTGGAVTNVYLRYNTGLHISDNGERLCRLLADLAATWPTEITRLTLVGHSMGGLVIRSACAHACADHDRWVDKVQRIVYLGAPHLGAPLEVGAAKAAQLLRRLPETRAVAGALASRSVGIKDLRFGDVSADDWIDLDLDGPRDEPDRCAPLLETAQHFYIGATITRRHDTVVARVLGDALVPWHSASGDNRTRRLGLLADKGRHLAGLHHFDLLNHPRVYEVLREWLTA